MPSSFTIHEIAGGVWAAIAPSTSGPAVSNAAIIDLGDKTIVVDTFMTAFAAEELAGEVRRLTGRVPFLVVNSHWHSDHVRGNRVFEDSPIVGTSRMSELMVEDAPQTPEDFEKRAAAVKDFADRAAASAETPAQRLQADGMRALAEALVAESGTYRNVLPSILIGDRLDIDGERHATVLGYGRGHTESDLFVHLPDDGIVIAGDLVWIGVHPKTNDGFPGEWAQVLHRVGALEPTHVVPGHGHVGAAADIAAMAGYMHELDEMVTAVRAGDLKAGTATPPTGTERWQDLARFRGGLAALGSTAT
jgi:glyoxylase-like metal-dependent hydrolase (beta-lactamase superfamily II)